jgi:RHS repeat-associated protein
LLAWTDLDGNRVRYGYDNFGRLDAIADAEGRQIRFQYDGSSHVVNLTVTHPSLRQPEAIASFEYSRDGDLVTARGRSGAPVRYEYVDHRLVAITNRLGGRQFFGYDSQYRGIVRWRSDGGKHRLVRRDPESGLIEVTDSYGHRTLLFLDSEGHVVRRLDALGRLKEDVYDSAGNVLFSSLNVVGPPCITMWDEASSTQTTNCQGQETTIVYSAFDKPLRVAAPGGRVSVFEYDEKAHLRRAVDPDGNDVRLSYSTHGYVNRVEVLHGNDVRIEEEPLSTRVEDRLGLVGAERRDVFGSVLAFTGPMDEVMRMEYDAAGELARIVWPDGGDVRYAYNAEGIPIEARDENGAVVHMESDEFGRSTGITDPTGARYEIVWDREDHEVRITNPNGARAEFRYDAVGRVTEIAHFDGRRTQVEYDDADNAVRYLNVETGTDSRLCFTSLRGVETREPSGGPQWTFEYGAQAELVAASSARGIWQIAWTREGYLQSVQSPDRAMTITRDVMNRRTSVRDDRGLQIDYTWDIRSRLASLTVNGQFQWMFQYDARDLIVQMQCPGDLRIELSYDVMRRMTSRVLRNGTGAVLAYRRFTWSRADELLAVDDWRLGRSEFAVDTGGRLLGVARPNDVQERYEHDAAGNVLTTAQGERIAVDQGNRALGAGPVSFEYSGDGHVVTRRVGDRTIHYEYDGDDQLVRERHSDGVVIEHEYDFLGRRTAKRVGGRVTHYAWDGMALQSEWTDEGHSSFYIMLPDSPIPLGMLRNGEMYLLLFDQIGTVTEAFDTAGRLAWAGDSSAFGFLYSETGELDQPIRALGQYHDRESGLYYNWFRHYDPWLGRFISADPAGYVYSQNLYWYSSNPTTFVDVDGRGGFSGTSLHLAPRCDWTDAQMLDFNAKVKDLRAEIAKEGGAIRLSSTHFANYDREAICASAAEKWRNDCANPADPNERKVKNTDKPCKDNDADHRRELVLKGENECKNMTPRNASVNRSVGSQIGNALGEQFNDLGRTVITIKSITVDCCKKPDSKATPCIKNKNKWRTC